MDADRKQARERVRREPPPCQVRPGVVAEKKTPAENTDDERLAGVPAIAGGAGAPTDIGYSGITLVLVEFCALATAATYGTIHRRNVAGT
jgi:hypothetical protein